MQRREKQVLAMLANLVCAIYSAKQTALGELARDLSDWNLLGKPLRFGVSRLSIACIPHGQVVRVITKSKNRHSSPDQTSNRLNNYQRLPER